MVFYVSGDDVGMSRYVLWFFRGKKVFYTFFSECGIGLLWREVNIKISSSDGIEYTSLKL